MPINDDSFKELLQYMEDGVYFVDPDRLITFWNTGAEKITGFTAAEVLGKHCSDNILIHTDKLGNSLCMTGCPLSAALENKCTQNAEIYLHHKEGYRVLVDVKVVPIKDTLGKVIGAVEIFRERSNDAMLFQELKRMAFFDALTEMGNRRHADTDLKARFAEMKRYESPFGVLFIDIDNFKNINDTFGHETGDKVLRMVAKTISKNIRSFDTVSRWGGEEFLVILEKIDKAELISIAEKIHMLVGRSMLLVDNRPIRVTISTGATMAEKGDNSKSLIARADKLMYKSKVDGKDRITSD
ncbi:MAG: diguanylate cyclase [Candidatus Firestonebacteria bacterium RIFOXYA2_FULL_40_8]|nr:MAG: diguanylate cyclase [Candidatus Firestonebacteria bacterium RIFOXYA2_FULL_40_8]